MITKYRIGYFLLAVLVSLAGVSMVAPRETAAFTLKGEIINGTTGETDIDIDVTVINPMEHMKTVGKARAIGGAFSVENLDDSVSVYILRVDYNDVHYDYPVRPTGADPVEITAYIYEQTSSWNGVSVGESRFYASKHAGHLQIDRVYEITNNSEPPATIVGPEGFFKITFPEEMASLNGLYASTLGIPVEREPIETNEPGIFLVNYPIRPGATNVGLSYTVPYQNEHFMFSEKLLYNIDRFKIFSDDRNLKITSKSNDLVNIEDPHAAVAYIIDGLKTNDELSIHFAGGSSNTDGETQRTAIQIVPNIMEDLSFIVMAILLIALLVIVVMALRETQAPLEQNAQLKRHKDVLVTRLAKLDDLYETKAVPPAVYHAKRSELKNQLASLIYRLGTGTKSGGKSRPAKAKGLRTK